MEAALKGQIVEPGAGVCANADTGDSGTPPRLEAMDGGDAGRDRLSAFPENHPPEHQPLQCVYVR